MARPGAEAITAISMGFARMPDRLIENPVVNSPYSEPARHFVFDDQGITGDTAPGRRASEHLVPIAQPRKRGAQLAMLAPDLQERRANDLINRIRQDVGLWRAAGHPGVTSTTRMLLDHWLDPRRDRRLFSCQLEAVETAIFLGEVAGRGSVGWLGELDAAGKEQSNVLRRQAFKIATGGGKTVVMAMLIAWQALNKLANTRDPRFATAFLVVSPGITIRDRLRVLLPNDPDSAYRAMDLVPRLQQDSLNRASVVVTNFHQLARRDTADAARLTKQILAAGREESPFLETWDEVAARVCRDIPSRQRDHGVVVINDEAHHCYRRREVDAVDEELTGEERREAQREAEAGAVWISGLEAVSRKYNANNPDIREGMTRAAIDDAIARHAESETLYDQPFEDRKVVRVTGPFTVESLSPHRVVAPDPDEGLVPPSPDEVTNDARFRQQIVDNLRVAGVQNTVRNERLHFSALDPWPGAYIQAAGDYDEAGTSRRAAVAIGPEHGTVDADFVRQAAKEASRNLFDLLVICGYAFDARVGEEARQLGRLTVLKATINPDMQFGGELLKKSGAANLFTVFGEPDIALYDTPDGMVVEIHGVDVYDPTTGTVRSNSTDDIACWFIDTDYNEESFFVRHAYFTGAGDPYGSLHRALRAEIDEEAWASLYQTVSRPFAKPARGRIAVKVVNHYGDEVMKVYNSAQAVVRPAWDRERQGVTSPLLRVAEEPD